MTVCDEDINSLVLARLEILMNDKPPHTDTDTELPWVLCSSRRRISHQIWLVCEILSVATYSGPVQMLRGRLPYSALAVAGTVFRYTHVMNSSGGNTSRESSLPGRHR